MKAERGKVSRAPDDGPIRRRPPECSLVPGRRGDMPRRPAPTSATSSRAQGPTTAPRTAVAVPHPAPAASPPPAPRCTAASPAYINVSRLPGYGAYPAMAVTARRVPALRYPSRPRRLVRHTLHRRTWVWVVVVTAIVAGSLGGLLGAIVGANTQQTIMQKYFPNKSVLVKPQDIQEALAKVEPAVVSIDSQSEQGSVRSGATSPSPPGAG